MTMKKISQAELARRWGLSRERVRQYCAEADPMPLDSEDFALAWLSSHHPDRAAKIITAQTRQKPVPPNGMAGAPGEQDTDGDGVDVLVNRLRMSEQAAWKSLESELDKHGEERHEAVIEARTKHYNLCADARQTAEERYVKWLLESRQCMRTSDAMKFLGEVFEQINVQLNSVPYACGPRANPTDPVMAIEVLQDEVSKMRSVMIDGLEKMKKEFCGITA